MPDPRDDGGPAFPTQHTVADANDPSFKLGFGGMSLRDYFAGQVLAGMIMPIGEETAGWPSTSPIYRALAESAYAMADAMLEARKR